MNMETAENMTMTTSQIEGIILKGIGGFYYVRTKDGLIECKPRGVMRKKRVTPYVGDRVTLEISEGQMPQIVTVHERKNSLIRPPVANIDMLVMVCSICDPYPSTKILDRLIAVAEYKKIEPVIVITKTDLDREKADEFANIYRSAGFTTITVSPDSDEEITTLKSLMAGKVCAFSGNSGVGKSTLLNRISPKLSIPTGETSKKLGRGRHTTRHVELYELDNGALVADTPGFSSVEIVQFDIILKDEMENCFREFEPYLGQCKFTGCSHTKEKGCAVLAALNEGKIAKSRHESYLMMYDEAKQIKEWELDK